MYVSTAWKNDFPSKKKYNSNLFYIAENWIKIHESLIEYYQSKILSTPIILWTSSCHQQIGILLSLFSMCGQNDFFPSELLVSLLRHNSTFNLIFLSHTMINRTVWAGTFIFKYDSKHQSNKVLNWLLIEIKTTLTLNLIISFIIFI